VTRAARSTFALPLLAAVAAAGCGSVQEHAGSSLARVPTATNVRVETTPPAGGARSWARPALSRARRGYVATLRSGGAAASRAVKVRVTGIGYPARSSAGGTAIVGPGVAAPWTQIAHGQYTVSVAHRGTWLGLRVFSRGGRWRARVDGRYVDPRPRSVGSDYAMHTIGLRFARGRASQRHVVQFELSGGAWLAGVVAAAGDRLTLPPRPRGPSVYWLGDSYFAGGGSRYPGFSDLVHTASARLHAADVTVDALGGTGYLHANEPAHFPDYLTRARTNLRPGRAQPDLIVVGGSINDIGEQPGKVAAAARRLYAYLGRAVPRAKVFVVVFAPHFPVPANFAALDRAVLSAAAASPSVAGAFDLPAEVARSPGGLQGANGHPTQVGHDAYGRLIAAFIRARRR
jgi:lysophospholipase L1-like esterase